MSDILNICCDGACRGNGKQNNVGGWGVTLRYGEAYKEKKGHEFNTTNNQMEIIAAIEGLKAIKDRRVPVLLTSDSAYVINCLSQGWYVRWKLNGWKTAADKPVANKDLWEELICVREQFTNIRFAHIAGHSGHIDNERCDQLANMAMDLALEKRMDDLVENYELPSDYYA